MQDTIKQSWRFNQTPQEVWDYLTKPELIAQWLMKNDFQPVVGNIFHFSFTSKPGSLYRDGVECEVLEVQPFTRLSYSWNGGTKEGREFSSVVVWTLVPVGKGTTLQLEHNGFTFPEDILTHSDGWRVCLTRLEEAFKKMNNEVTNI